MSVQVKFTAAVGVVGDGFRAAGVLGQGEPAGHQKDGQPPYGEKRDLALPTANELEHAGTPLQLRWL